MALDDALLGTSARFDGKRSTVALPVAVREAIASSPELTVTAWVRRSKDATDRSVGCIFCTSGAEASLKLYMSSSGVTLRYQPHESTAQRTSDLKVLV